jgi:hypothetical protein
VEVEEKPQVVVMALVDLEAEVLELIIVLYLLVLLVTLILAAVAAAKVVVMPNLVLEVLVE